MVDKETKFLRRLQKKERAAVRQVVEAISTGDLSHLDVKKLLGKKHFFRVRVGSIRIIFHKEKDQIYIVSVERRGDTTY